MTVESSGNSRSSIIFAPGLYRRRLQLRISERRLLLMAGDALAVIFSVLIALRIWALVAREPFTLDFVLPQISWFFALSVLWFVIASANDFYNLASIARRSAALQKLILITLQLLVVYLIVFFFSERDALPRLFIIYYGIASFIFVALWRMVNPALIGWASAPRRVLIVGADDAALSMINTLRYEAGESYEVKGVIGSSECVGETIADVPVIGTEADILNYISRDFISELVITSTQELSEPVLKALMDAYERGVAITPMPILYERVTERVPVEHVGSHWAIVLPVGGISVLNPYPPMKRLVDIVLSLLGLVILVLLLPFIAIAIWLDSRGPIFYRQQRVGLNGRLFRIIKFRTMIPDAEKYSGAVFAERNDPRVTRMGNFMRKTRIDELPQLINIFRGDMSLIGPRPERPEHVQRLQEKIPFYRTRHTVRPGLTGWAQVRYSYGANDHDALVKLQYDLYYIRHQSLLLDLTILIRTVGKVIRMAGQ